MVQRIIPELDSNSRYSSSHMSFSRIHPKSFDTNSFRLAGEPGFEPRLPGPEPGVLPLNYSPIFIGELLPQKCYLFYC